MLEGKYKMKKLLFMAAAAIAVSCGNKQQAIQAEGDSTNYVFGNKEATDEVINSYCTKRLAKKLADDYEYEGGGYAVWDFRSGAQDGDSDVQQVDSVKALGEGEYKVSYNDMGNKGSCVISVIVDGDHILFDNISKK